MKYRVTHLTWTMRWGRFYIKDRRSMLDIDGRVITGTQDQMTQLALAMNAMGPTGKHGPQVSRDYRVETCGS